MIAEFASPVEAVRCATEIQLELDKRSAGASDQRRMRFRIGVNLGDVVVDGGNLMGDGVNIAARLEALAPPGGVCVSEDVYRQVRGKTELAFEDLGTKSLKNIVEPVQVFRVRDGPWARTPPQNTGGAPTPPEKPSIAVLPFANMSSDPEQGYFADGIAEDLITDISKISGLLVIARNSSFSYKGRSVDIRQVATDLGVRYVLEGSVRRSGNMVRITAQLIDTASRGHLWAERYDRELVDVFAVQDEITREIVAALSVRLTANEEQRVSSRYVQSVDAYDLFLKARARFREYDRLATGEAAALLDRAIELEPHFAAAFALRSYFRFVSWIFDWAGDETGLRIALTDANHAVALDDGLAQAHARLGWLLLWMKDYDRSIAEVTRAVELDPNDAEAVLWRSDILNFLGRPEEAISVAEQALRLDPLNPSDYPFNMGHAHFLLKQYDEAIRFMKPVADRSPNFPIAHIYLAAIYAESGFADLAAQEVDAARRCAPGISLGRFPDRIPYRDAATQARLVAAVRRAGLIE